ncbi:MAG: hypothetical protein QM831_38915 [Kofleriaceae bacterium]
MRLACVLGLLVACGGGGGNPNTGDDDVQPDAAAPDAYVPPGYQMLISGDWTLPAPTSGSVEMYKCVKLKVPQDMWINSFRSLAPTGSHHEVLTITDTASQLGVVTDCSPNESLMDKEMLYAAGVGTDDFTFPDGVAIHLTAGTYINLNLHLFNASDNPLTGTSGVLVKTVDQASVVNEAAMVFGGRLPFTIPAAAQPYQVTGTCSAAADFHIVALWPHMHQIATHQSIQLNGTMLLDTDYSFTDQKNYPIADTLVKASDTLTTTCTYMNTTGAAVSFGEYTEDEMCFSGMYRYPPSNSANSEIACAYQQPI